jgi:hypothetical protein
MVASKGAPSRTLGAEPKPSTEIVYARLRRSHLDIPPKGLIAPPVQRQSDESLTNQWATKPAPHVLSASRLAASCRHPLDFSQVWHLGRWRNSLG